MAAEWQIEIAGAAPAELALHANECYEAAVMRLAEFENACRHLAAATVHCSAWSLAFTERDFQREFVVAATLGTSLSAVVVVPSASTSTSTPAETLAALGKLLHELKSGEDDGTHEYRRLIAELTQVPRAVPV